MLRIIGGKYKHRKLEQPPLNITRATKDATKEGLFNSLGNEIVDSVFLDLFSGSGAIGIEAYSRGAKSVYLVDKSLEAVNTINKNLINLDIKEITVINCDYNKALKKLKSKNLLFDFVFLDPPYKFTINIEFVKFLENSGVLRDNCKILIETDYRIDLNEFSKYNAKMLKYGKTYIYILRRKI